MIPLIFDIDGTLWDSREPVALGINTQLDQEGIPGPRVTAEELTRLFGLPLREFADGLFPQVPPEERYAMAERGLARELQFIRESACSGYPGVKATMEAMRGRRLFIVSNSQQGYPELCIEKLGLEGCIEGHLCYGDTKAEKGRTIRILMERYGLESAAYVGDTQGDLEACRQAGIPFIWARYGFGTPREYDYVIDDFPQLLVLPLP